MRRRIVLRVGIIARLTFVGHEVGLVDSACKRFHTKLSSARFLKVCERSRSACVEISSGAQSRLDCDLEHFDLETRVPEPLTNHFAKSVTDVSGTFCSHVSGPHQTKGALRPNAMDRVCFYRSEIWHNVSDRRVAYRS